VKGSAQEAGRFFLSEKDFCYTAMLMSNVLVPEQDRRLIPE